MTDRQLMHWPDPLLREVSHPVVDFGPKLQELVDEMDSIMNKVRGAGLSAVQVGAPSRVFVLSPFVAGGDAGGPPLVFVNPEISPLPGEEVLDDEGCLSFPGVFVPVRRAARAAARSQDRSGRWFELEAEGLFARALLHEADHLLGRTMLDAVGPVSRKIILAKMRKLERRR
jgi:peptide deformylase